MKGVQFLVDENGEKTAVQIDLKEWGEFWEDIYDVLVSISRMGESRVKWEDLKAEMDSTVKNEV